ncbi:Nickel transport system permease protein NikC [Methanosarcina horonobensis HB-1 = JCM 15518]|uniref:Nickel transport system permease protein NikC n=1 Tax=Methanosarcina horonobensis HB-1 = JCM 15518 TaxID=1434110 RepID=A0A0E3S8D1_9EURY|nr:Nickel transport system permease protein NikC [Methanosarcina horonobensis HB-1 = JCM 15518]
MPVWEKLKQDRLAMCCLVFLSSVVLVGIFAPFFAPNDPLAVDTSLRFAGPSFRYPLGNDQLGRCVLSRLIYAIRPSVLYVLFALLITVMIGAVLGMISGYHKGRVDNVIMRLCDVMLSFPGEVITLAIIGVFGVGLQNILLASILTKWAWFTRVIRTSVMQFTEQNYVRFAKAAGCSPFHVLTRHILPMTFSEIAVIFSSSVCSMILQISGFSFLGLGIQAPAPEWGMMLNEAKDVMLSYPALMLPPGIAVMLVSASFGFLGDSLRDAMDPKHEPAAAKRREGRAPS